MRKLERKIDKDDEGFNFFAIIGFILKKLGILKDLQDKIYLLSFS